MRRRGPAARGARHRELRSSSSGAGRGTKVRTKIGGASARIGGAWGTATRRSGGRGTLNLVADHSGGGLGSLIGVADAVDDSDRGQYSQHPEDRGHPPPAVEERTQNDQNHTFRPLHEADLTGAD